MKNTHPTITFSPSRPKRILPHFLMLLTIVFFCMGQATVRAQTPDPTPTPTEEEQRLQDEKRLLDLKKEIEEDKKAIRDAQPTSAATPLSGDTTLSEGVRLETEIVSYKAMAKAAKLIAAEIKSKRSDAQNIAIYDGQVIKDWRFYQTQSPAFKGFVNDLRQRYIDLFCADPDTDPRILKVYCGATAVAARAEMPLSEAAGAFAAGSTLVKSFIDLAALFRTDTKIEGNSVTIEQSALNAEVLRRLRDEYKTTKDFNLYIPGMFPPRKSSNSSTITQIGELFLFKKEADQLIKLKSQGKPDAQQKLDQDTEDLKKVEDELEQVNTLDNKLTNLNLALTNEHNPAIKKKIRAEIASVKVQMAALTDKSELEKQKKNLEAKIVADKAPIEAIEASVKALTDVNDRFQSFFDEFIKVGSDGTNTLALFVKSEDIDQIMNNANSFWLEIRSVSAGGNNRTRKNLIWFFAGARVDHSGGVVLEYTLYDCTGAVVYSDKLSHYEGYVEPKKIMQKPAKGAKFEDPQ